MRLSAWFLFALLCALGTAQAHELRPAFLEIQASGLDRYDVLWKVPARGEFQLSLDARFPDGCETVSPVTNEQTGLASISRWRIRCEGGLSGKTVAIDGLTSTFTDVLVRMIHEDGTIQTSILSPELPQLTIMPNPTTMDTARAYFLLGVDHILGGIDHLLFVLALLLLIPSVRLLVETITAFTVAHSITLAFAAFGWSNVPQQPVEALIALSIVIVAAEIVNSQRGRRDFSIRFPWVIAFAFGLLHGFGFGGALREIGLPQNDVPMALLSFNIGVEAGQLLFVFAVLAVFAVAKRLFHSAPGMMRMGAAYGIGSVAAFWFVERLSLF